MTALRAHEVERFLKRPDLDEGALLAYGPDAGLVREVGSRLVRHYAAAGIPTVLYGAGPRTLADANGHRPDERLRLADLHRATEVVALTLADLLEPRAAA